MNVCSMLNSSQEEIRTKRLAVMQPYFLPYLGYWQLMASVDEFMLYPLVDYSRKSYVLRNQWVEEGRGVWFQLPVSKAPLRSKILDLEWAELERWRRIWFKSCRAQYGKSKYFHETMTLLESFAWSDEESVCEFLEDTIVKTARFIGLSTTLSCAKAETFFRIEEDVRDINDAFERRHNRIERIAKHVGASEYVNATSGRHLYDSEKLMENGVKLGFIDSFWHRSATLASEPFSQASLLHLLMNYGRDQVRRWVHPESKLMSIDWKTNVCQK